MLAAKDQCWCIIVPNQQVLRIIQASVRKKADIGKLIAVEDKSIAAIFCLYVAKVPQLYPKSQRIGNRPSMEGFEAGQ